MALVSFNTAFLTLVSKAQRALWFPKPKVAGRSLGVTQILLVCSLGKGQAASGAAG